LARERANKADHRKGGQLELRITNLAEAETALDYFNGFHDGFIQELRLVSRDFFESRGVQRLTGDFDLTLVFSHYNYDQDRRPADQFVSARFNRVKDFELCVSGVAHEWSVNHMAVTECSSATCTDSSGPRLRAVIVQNHLNEERTWELREVLSFSFDLARLTEDER
jgi:hypothetical protein